MAKPLAISVGRIEDLEKFEEILRIFCIIIQFIDLKFSDLRWSHVTVPNETMEQLLPGPVTLVFDRKPTLPAELNPNTKSIGIRIPNNRFMIELAQCVDEPIALTSANLSNQPSSLKIQVRISLYLNTF